MRIGVFDSGLGGLSVLKELIKKYPNNEYIYVGDNLNVPYGDKSIQELQVLTTKIINFLNSKDVDLIVVACGTISTNFNFRDSKVIKVVDATINYVNNNYSHVGLMATNRTIESNYFQKRLNVVADVLKTPLLVPMIESGKIDLSIINNYMASFKDIDALILGCTHYALIKDYLPFKVVDMGVVLANSLNLSNDGVFKLNLYFTKVDDLTINNVKKIMGECTVEECIL